ncbi:hypothetical protein FACS1894187_05650 [Synergistales bacterium]|nr:hypothetical protein FACS1894187_05650 [Synergistales bacterium]
MKKNVLVAIFIFLAELFTYAGIAESAMSTQEFFNVSANGKPQEVEVAIQSGADINAKDNYDGYTALMYAAKSNPDPEVIALLLENDAEINTKNKDAQTALMIAALYNPNAEITALLIANGADVNTRDEKYGMTALIYAAWKNANSEVVALLLKNGSDVNAQSEDGWTALMVAAMETTNSKIITLLLKAGADAQMRNTDGKRAIDYAKGNIRIKGTDAFKQLQEASRVVIKRNTIAQ